MDGERPDDVRPLRRTFCPFVTERLVLRRNPRLHPNVDNPPLPVDKRPFWGHLMPIVWTTHRC